jgi:hypothetical protein
MKEFDEVTVIYKVSVVTFINKDNIDHYERGFKCHMHVRLINSARVDFIIVIDDY